MFAPWKNFMKMARLSPHRFVRRILDKESRPAFELSSTPLDFNPRPGWLVESNGIPHHLFYFCLQGSIAARIRSAGVQISAGEAIWIFPGTPFLLRAQAPSRTSISRFRLRMKLSRNTEASIPGDFLKSQGNHRVNFWLEVLRQEAFFQPDGNLHSMRCALGGLLGAAFLARPGCGARASSVPRFSNLQVRFLNGWFHRLPPQIHPTSAEAARELQLSRDYANRLSHATFGKSLEQWLISQRILSSAQRLAEYTLTVSEVAAEYGYASLFYFSRQFRQVAGLTASAYRRVRI